MLVCGTGKVGDGSEEGSRGQTAVSLNVRRVLILLWTDKKVTYLVKDAGERKGVAIRFAF